MVQEETIMDKGLIEEEKEALFNNNNKMSEISNFF